MKTHGLISIGLGVAAIACAPSSSGTTAAGSAADSAAIRALATSVAVSYSHRDANAFGALVVSDYQEADPNGSRMAGKQAATDSLKAMFAQMPAGITMTDTTTFIRFLSPTSAVAGGTWAMSPSTPGMAARGSWMAAVVKQDSTWLIASSMGADDDAAAMAAMRDTTKGMAKKGK